MRLVRIENDEAVLSTALLHQRRQRDARVAARLALGASVWRSRAVASRLREQLREATAGREEAATPYELRVVSRDGCLVAACKSTSYAAWVGRRVARGLRPVSLQRVGV